MSLNWREMLRLGAYGAAGAILSTAASSSVLPSLVMPAAADPLAPSDRRRSRRSLTPSAPAGIDPQLFAQRQGRARPASDLRRATRSASSTFRKPSSEPRFHLVDLASGQVESHRVCHGRGSDPAHSGYLERFSNDFGSYATLERHLHDRRLL